ncbi:MAG: N-(5'-phosphoribosyl)anthranilate isomerase [Gemmatimonadota bacterium]
MADGPAVKICGLTRRQDAEEADALGADYLGVVLTGGFSRSVDPAVAAGVVSGLRATPVAVLVDEAPDAAAALADGLGAGVVQLHGAESPDDVERLRSLGGWRLWKSVRASGPGDVEDAVRRFGSLVDGILVEGRKAGVVGGGGARVDPDAVGRLRDLVSPPLRLVLAGGLTPDSVAAAVNRHGPDVVDVSSGVERETGRKDRELLRRFLIEARRVRSPEHPLPSSGDVP